MTDPLMLLSQDHGEGRLTYRALKAGGFSELSSIADAPVRTIADRGHFSMQTAQRLKTGAREMIRKGMGGTAPRNPRAKPEAASPRTTRRFSEGVTRQEALTLQRDEPRPGEEPSAEPPPAAEVPAPAPSAPIERDGTFWSFG